MIKFELTTDEADRFLKWRNEVDARVKAKQEADPRLKNLTVLMPYYGAIDGAYTFSFTPTTLGEVIKVRNELTKEEIDLTDYDLW